jgi:proteasome lid subunit RPN8/RPN11
MKILPRMTEPAIRLLPTDRLKPRRGHIPIGWARRWRSPLEPTENEMWEPAVTVFVSQKAFVRVCAHAGSDLSNEVGGWLIGKWRADKESGEQFIIVEAILPAPHTRHGSAYLTFTQDTQVALHEELEQRYPGKELVGWYHTHPYIGVFLSEYDTWLHQNFFPELHQVALVIEPYSARGGFFIRQADGSLDPRHYFGFYEIHNRKKRSVVHWRNLSSESEVETRSIK